MNDELIKNKKYSYRMAQKKSELESALQLIAEVYGESDYISLEAENEFSIGKYLLRPEAATFIAVSQGVVYGTISTILDGPNGLPIDTLFKDELEMYRKDNQKIAEVCQFAVERRESSERDAKNKTQNPTAGITRTVQLINLAFHYGIYKQCNFLCFTINPKHSLFYESMGCVQIGTEKNYPAVNNKPALAYVLSMEKLKNGLEGGLSGYWFLSKLIKNPPDYKIFEATREY